MTEYDWYNNLTRESLIRTIFTYDIEPHAYCNVLGSAGRWYNHELFFDPVYDGKWHPTELYKELRAVIHRL